MNDHDVVVNQINLSSRITRLLASHMDNNNNYYYIIINIHLSHRKIGVRQPETIVDVNTASRKDKQASPIAALFSPHPPLGTLHHTTPQL
jgi:hypothetical protein